MADFADSTNNVRLTILPIKIHDSETLRWIYSNVCLVDNQGNHMSFYFNLSAADINILLDNCEKLAEGSAAALKIKDADSHLTLETAAGTGGLISVDWFHDGEDCKKHLTSFLTTKDYILSFLDRLARECRELPAPRTAGRDAA